MRADLVAALDAFDRVVAAADGLVDPETLQPVARTVRQVRDRAGYLGDTLLAAVAGGTGSGKSSLVNALAGEIVTETGGMRPTTGRPMAWIPANPEPGLVRLLDDLGVTERTGQDLYPWLALIDLPDTDSVVVDHRHTVQALLPRVDLVIWVIDPEKYQDRLLHDGYLRPLADYWRQFVFVLNQTDRLEEGTVADLVSDLESSLAADGMREPRIVVTAADPVVGPPVGVDILIELLEATVDVKRLVYDKLATDLRGAAGRLAEAPDLSGPVGFETRWESARREAALLLAGGDDTAARRRLDGLVDELAGDAGGGAASALREQVDSRVVGEAVEVAYETSGAFRVPEAPAAPVWVPVLRWLAVAAVVAGGVWLFDGLRQGGDPQWAAAAIALAVVVWLGLGRWSSELRTREHRRLLDEHRESLVEPISGHLETQMGRKLRTVLRRRASVTAAATELNLALAELDRRLESPG